MLTEEIVDELIQRFNGMNRDGEHGVLRYLNSAHEILMTQEAEQNLIFDPATGKLPPLNTTAGTFNYVMPTTTWRVAAILIENAYPGAPTVDYGSQPTIMTDYKNSVVIGGITYARIPYIRAWDYINANTPAHVMFTKDPLTKADYYFRQSYRRPTQILSESIQCDIQPPWDFDVLIPAAAHLIEGALNGNYDEARRIIRVELKTELWRQLDSGDQGYLDTEPVDRGF
jgi:hypothetical protein